MDDLIRRADVQNALEHLRDIMPLDSDRFVLADVAVQVIDIPAVDAAEVVHGTWEETYNVYGTEIIVCSACKYEAGLDLGNFCPNCGARMDGCREEEHNAPN